MTPRLSQNPDDNDGALPRLPLFAQKAPRAEPLNGQHQTAWDAHPPVVAGPPVVVGMDWALVAALRAQASEQLSQAVAADRGRLDRVAQQDDRTPRR